MPLQISFFICLSLVNMTRKRTKPIAYAAKFLLLSVTRKYDAKKDEANCLYNSEMEEKIISQMTLVPQTR